MDPMNRAKELIERQIPDAIVEVSDLTGTRDHVSLLVASDVFKGKNLLEQHRMVMDILKEEFSQELHAVQIKTMTKEKRMNS
ncbi:MAG: BolA family transcriptional regulator [Bacteriovoracales bacterium]|nr:BolA family transcriptional regulator [Bacteriovoracales bacterium]